MDAETTAYIPGDDPDLPVTPNVHQQDAERHTMWHRCERCFFEYRVDRTKARPCPQCRRECWKPNGGVAIQRLDYPPSYSFDEGAPVLIGVFETYDGWQPIIYRGKQPLAKGECFNSEELAVRAAIELLSVLRADIELDDHTQTYQRRHEL